MLVIDFEIDDKSVYQLLNIIYFVFYLVRKDGSDSKVNSVEIKEYKTLIEEVFQFIFFCF